MQSFKDRVLVEVIKYSKLYKKNLVDYEYLILSNNFKYKDFYIIHCKAENYMHLTGIRSNLKAVTFFNKCINNTLTEDDINFGKNTQKQKHIKGTIRRKIKILDSMVNIFSNKELYFQEKFKKNKVYCDIATSESKCTLGFIGKSKSRPMTLLSGNILSNPQKIDLILKRKKGQKKFTKIVYGNKNLLEEYKNNLEKYNIL